MIDKALKIINFEVNQFIKLHFDLNEEKVLLCSIVDQEGKIAINDENKILLTLIDIAEEGALKNGYTSIDGGVTRVQTKGLHLNLFVMFSAYFNALNYDLALKYISAILSFFHAKPTFTKNNCPALGQIGIQKLVFEMHHLDSNSKNNVWSTLGAKYMPSVIYKVRMLTLPDDSIRSTVESIHGIGMNKIII
ncbi:MAG: hypothetical protein ACJAUV_000777 [Flavobacteriales bacterium]|jgi:hypothetical protein